jgi:hypothetical protein
MSKPRRRYVVCVQAEGAEGLELRKLYEVREDETAGSRGYLRVVDESGEDFLYPKECFAPVDVPEDTERAPLRRAACAKPPLQPAGIAGG